jgi:molybdate transport system substrate-binding protein
MRDPAPRSAWALALAAALAAPGCASRPPETRIAAAISLRPAFLELADAIHARDPEHRLSFEFAGSGAIVAQIEQGAPFDAVAFAGEEEMDRLESDDLLLPGSRADFAGNRLVVAVPAGGPIPASLADLADPAFSRIALGDPDAVPGGRYARQALERAGIWGRLRPRLVFCEHVAQVRAYVARGETEAGFLYRSDLIDAGGVQLAFEVDAALHEPIRYPAAILREAHDADGADRFLRLLADTLGQVVLRRHGFAPPPAPPGGAEGPGASG